MNNSIVGKRTAQHLYESLRPGVEEGAHTALSPLTDIWIIDNGSGMTAKVIEECWMVIGTNDKEMNVVSQKGTGSNRRKGNRPIRVGPTGH